MADIHTLTLNPALDLFTSIDKVTPVHKLRCDSAQTHPGGGGINVARVIHRLGGDVLAWHTAGGVTGRLLSELLAQEEVPARAIAIHGETRESFSVHERQSGQDFRFLLPGPTLSEGEWQGCLQALSAGLPPTARWVIASGSLPPGAPHDFYARLALAVRQQGAKAVVDTSGPALAAALRAGVYLIKPSLRELQELTGRELSQDGARRDAARQLIDQGGAEVVALSLGEEGALLVTAKEAWRARALDVEVASTIGAGDSFLAALVWALSGGKQHEDALRHAMAAGAAALLASGTALCRPEDITRLLPLVQINAA